MMNLGVEIVLSLLSGVQLHSSIFSDHYDNSKQSLLKPQDLRPISKFDYTLLILHHKLHVIFLYFMGYKIKGKFVSSCLIIIIPSLCNRPPRLALMMIYSKD